MKPLAEQLIALKKKERLNLEGRNLLSIIYTPVSSQGVQAASLLCAQLFIALILKSRSLVMESKSLQVLTPAYIFDFIPTTPDLFICGFLGCRGYC